MRRLSAAIAASCLCLGMLAGKAEATLIGQSVTVTLTDGGGLLFDDVVTVAAAAELAAGDGSEIGGVLLPSESVDIGPASILLTLEEGVPSGGTGYPAGTAYVFTNLSFLGQLTEITGVTLATTNLSGITVGHITFTATSVRVPIDLLTIGEIAGVDTGSMMIGLTFTVVPEPGSASLLALGLTGVACARRRACRAA
jgi:hypothetical protein